MKTTTIKFLRKLITFLLIMAGYAILIYGFCAYLAWDIDFRYWWDWQQAVFITAMICYGSCIFSKMITEKKPECEHPFYAVQSKCNGEINHCLKCGKQL